MVDIAASLSLTPSSTAFDPAAILGAETADNQAFGDILAGQVKAKAGDGAGPAPLSPLPTLPPLPAGNRQPGGKILPGLAQILPDAVIVGVEAPSAQGLAALEGGAAKPVATLPPAADAGAAKPVLAALTVRLAASFPHAARTAQAGDALAETAPEPTELDAARHPAHNPVPNPVHSLIKTLAAAFKGSPATEKAAPDAPVSQSETTADAEDALSAVSIPAAGQPMAETALAPAVSAPTVAALAVSTLPILVGTEPRPVASEGAANPGNGNAAPTPSAQTLTASPTPINAMADLLPASAVTPQGAVSAPARHSPVRQPAIRPAQGETASIPVLTVAAAPVDVAARAAAPSLAAVPAVTLAPAQPHLANHVATAHIRVAKPEAATAQPVAADRAAVAPAERIALADPFMPTAAPIVVDGQAQTATPAPSANTSATVEMPRHDFAALVERLVEARNASASNSTHASVTHAEFGQVSLNFQQDGNDLKVGMSAADPEFAVAVQAALPAERQNLNADGNTRGQSQGQSQNQSQSAAGSSAGNHETAGQRSGDAADQQNGRQGRNPRGGANSSNPSPRWADRDQPQSRGGIFA